MFFCNLQEVSCCCGTVMIQAATSSCSLTRESEHCVLMQLSQVVLEQVGETCRAAATRVEQSASSGEGKSEFIGTGGGTEQRHQPLFQLTFQKKVQH